MIDLFGCSEPTPMRPGRPIEVTMSSSRKPGTTLLGLSLPTPSHISVALQTIGDLFLVCNHTGTYIQSLFTKVYTYSHTHELAQLLLIFQTTCISGN